MRASESFDATIPAIFVAWKQAAEEHKARLQGETMTPGLGKEVTSWMLAAAAAGAAAVTGKLLDLQSIDTELFWLPGLTSLAGTAWLWVRRRELEASRLRQGYAAASFLFGAAVAMVVADVLQDNRWHSVKPGIVIGFGIAAAWIAWRCVPQATERAVARKVAVVLVVLPALVLAVAVPLDLYAKRQSDRTHLAQRVAQLARLDEYNALRDEKLSLEEFREVEFVQFMNRVREAEGEHSASD